VDPTVFGARRPKIESKPISKIFRIAHSPPSDPFVSLWPGRRPAGGDRSPINTACSIGWDSRPVR
jgi:hypothetical protein